MIALIPARSGSKRVINKNTRILGHRPIVAWTIQPAMASGLFEGVFVCTDSQTIGRIAMDYGAVCLPRDPVPDDQPDIVWIRQAMSLLSRRYDSFCILRPTSPFRTVDMLNRAMHVFRYDQTADSIRAVEEVRQHPGKMWEWRGQGYPITPLIDKKHPDGTPWHSSPTQSLPKYYVQNSSLEMAWTANVEVHGTISGRKVAPFFCQGYEGFTIDYPEDWERAECLVAEGAVSFPSLPVAAQGPAVETQQSANSGGSVDLRGGI